MITSISKAIFGTPWWVWLLFGYLLYLGVSSLKSKVVPLGSIFIMPAIFVFLSIQSLYVGFSITNLIIWSVSLIIGYYIGVFLLKKMPVRADKHKHFLWLPGTKVTLIVILTIFLIKYYFGYKAAVNPELLNHFMFNVARLGIFSIITGLSVGRAMSLLMKYKNAKHTDL